MENTKRDLSLDFTKPRHLRGGQPPPTLITPSITLLGLSTPELNKMISGEELAVLTPTGISSVIPQSNVLPSPLIPTTVNNSNNIINNTTSNNNNNINNNSINNNSHHLNINNNNNNNSSHLKQRSEKPSRDIDSEKIEKKRERNRLAAKKCRQRKLETIDELRKTVSDWEQKYERLHADFERFKNVKNKEVEQLMGQINELKSLIR